MRSMRLLAAFLAVAFLAAWLSRHAPTVAQDKPAPEAKQEKGPLEGFPDLVGALKRTPGCLGVETARTSSGKNAIFAWFEDKKAVLAFYDGDVHQQAMATFFPDAEARTPLAGVPDDAGPILVVASITFADKPKFEETKLPISQIAIELYTPLHGGIALGGKFAPKEMKVEGLKEVEAK